MTPRPALLEDLRKAENAYSEAVGQAIENVVSAGLANRVFYLVRLAPLEVFTCVEITDPAGGDPIILSVYDGEAGDDLARLGIGSGPTSTADECDFFLKRMAPEASEFARALTLIERKGGTSDFYVVVARGGTVERMLLTSGDPTRERPSELLRSYVPNEVFYDTTWDVEFETVLDLIANRDELLHDVELGATHAALTGTPIEWSRAFLTGSN